MSAEHPGAPPSSPSPSASLDSSGAPPANGKPCSHCQRTLPQARFSRNKSNADGLQSWCKACIRERFTYSVDRVTVQHKLCGHCKLLKPSTDYNKNKARRDGLSVQCKACLKEMTRARPRTLAPAVQSKVCSTCGLLKPAADYFASTRHRDGLTYACKACEAKKKKRRKVAAPTVDHKLCARCAEDKPAAQFHADPYTSSGLCRYCRDCVLAQRWANRVLHPTAAEKKCSLCAALKPAADFTRNTFTSDGLASWCRTCTVQATKRKRYEETAQKALEQLASGSTPPAAAGPPHTNPNFTTPLAAPSPPPTTAPLYTAADLLGPAAPSPPDGALPPAPSPTLSNLLGLATLGTHSPHQLSASTGGLPPAAWQAMLSSTPAAFLSNLTTAFGFPLPGLPPYPPLSSPLGLGALPPALFSHPPAAGVPPSCATAQLFPAADDGQAPQVQQQLPPVLELQQETELQQQPGLQQQPHAACLLGAPQGTALEAHRLGAQLPYAAAAAVPPVQQLG